jgi:hypothetical protein
VKDRPTRRIANSAWHVDGSSHPDQFCQIWRLSPFRSPISPPYTFPRYTALYVVAEHIHVAAVLRLMVFVELGVLLAQDSYFFLRIHAQ